MKWRRVKKEENLNQKGGNFANLVNRKHILQDSIKNNQQKARKRHFRPILCPIRTLQRASKTEKGGNQIVKRLKENEKKGGIQPKG